MFWRFPVSLNYHELRFVDIQTSNMYEYAIALVFQDCYDAVLNLTPPFQDLPLNPTSTMVWPPPSMAHACCPDPKSFDNITILTSPLEKFLSIT